MCKYVGAKVAMTRVSGVKFTFSRMLAIARIKYNSAAPSSKQGARMLH